MWHVWGSWLILERIFFKNSKYFILSPYSIVYINRCPLVDRYRPTERARRALASVCHLTWLVSEETLLQRRLYWDLLQAPNLIALTLVQTTSRLPWFSLTTEVGNSVRVPFFLDSNESLCRKQTECFISRSLAFKLILKIGSLKQ